MFKINSAKLILFFNIVLALTIAATIAVFAWNSPTSGPPNPAGQTLFSDSNNNIGVGTLYPGAKLEVYSTLSDSVLKLSRQSATSTLFNLGIDSALVINNNNSDVLTIKNSRVGIGTTNPFNGLDYWGDPANTGLHIKGQVMAALLIEGGSGATISLYDQTAGINQKNVRLATDDGKTFFATMNDNNTWKNDKVLVIDNDTGNVGIGTVNPGQKLSVAGTIESTSLKLSRQSATSTLFNLGIDSALVINNNNSDVLTIKNSRVGIGTTNPFNILGYWIDPVNAGLHIKGQATAALLIEGGSGATISLYDQTAGINQKNVRLATDDGKTFFATMNDNNTFKNDKVLVIDNDTGNVGIGTVNPGQKLSVAGTIESTSGGIKFPDGSTQTTAASGGVPSGAIMFFNLSSCPSGWSEATNTRGRYIVGLPAGGTLAGTDGTALSNLEDRPTGEHTHRIDLRQWQPNEWNPDYGVAYDNNPNVVGSIYTAVPPNSIPGTNAPYIQYLTCQKN